MVVGYGFASWWPSGGRYWPKYSGLCYAGDMAKARVKGGDGFNQELKRARQQKPTQIEVGIFPDAVYPDGEQVALVGLRHEYGLGGRAESAPYRKAGHPIAIETKRHNKRVKRDGPGREVAEALGRDAAEKIKQTIAQAALIQTGRYLRSIRHEVKRNENE